MHIRLTILSLLCGCQALAASLTPYVGNKKMAIVTPYAVHEKELREKLTSMTSLPEVLAAIIIAYMNEYSVVAVFQYPHAISRAALSKDGKWIAVAAHSGLVSLWNGLTKAHVRLIDAHWDPITAVSFNSENTLLATASNDKTARIWDVNTGNERAAFKGHAGYLNAVAFSPDGEYLVTGSDDRKIGLWHVETARLVRMLHRHTDFVCSAAFNNAGNQLVSSGNDAMVHLWDMRSPNVTGTLFGHADDVNSASFSLDGQRVLTGSDDKTVRVWDSSLGKPIQTLYIKERINSAVFDTLAERVLVAGDREKAYIFDVTKRHHRAIQALDTCAKPVYSASFGLHDEDILTASSDSALLWSLLGSRLYSK